MEIGSILENAPRLGHWQLAKPRIITLAPIELNAAGKLCLANDEQHLWYSYGRKIFVLDIETLKLITTIMTPTNERSIQFAMQSMIIDNMELLAGQGNLRGVWVSFKGSPLIQLYDFKNFKLIYEISLLESVNRILSYGNEILRQHKTACLSATSLLNVYRQNDNTNSLFVGTSAGVIIYLTIRNNLDEIKENNLMSRQTSDSDFEEPLVESQSGATIANLFEPQVVSLRHGHSGQVKFLRLVELIDDDRDDEEGDRDLPKQLDSGDEQAPKVAAQPTGLCLVSGGAGLDLYGPDHVQQVTQHVNNDEDCLNHLILWQL